LRNLLFLIQRNAYNAEVRESIYKLLRVSKLSDVIEKLKDIVKSKDPFPKLSKLYNGIGKKLESYGINSEEQLRELRNSITRDKVKVITVFSDEYPVKLMSYGLYPPLLLFIKTYLDISESNCRLSLEGGLWWFRMD